MFVFIEFALSQHKRFSCQFPCSFREIVRGVLEELFLIIIPVAHPQNKENQGRKMEGLLIPL